MAHVVAAQKLFTLVSRALQRAGATAEVSDTVARHLLAAEAQGLTSHGLSRTPMYCGHLSNGRTDGKAVPKIAHERGGAVLIDAGYGMAFPACDLAIAEAIQRARSFGVSFAGVTNSHHLGVAALHLRPVAQAGMVGLAFGNSPAAIAAWGGRTPLFGTNPIAAVFPRREAEPLVIDLALSQVARGKIMVAAQRGESIPEGWALDREGRPTTDAQAGLEGTMAPAGGVKGAMLALTVELLCCALTGAAFGSEVDSFFSDSGNRSAIGQAFLVVDPDALAGRAVYLERVEALVAAMLADDGVRLPGDRRRHNEHTAQADGISVPDALYEKIVQLAGEAVTN